MIICPPCQAGPDKVAFYRKNESGRPTPVHNWELCASRILRCRWREIHLISLRKRANTRDLPAT
jgi:hypothetical protein